MACVDSVLQVVEFRNHLRLLGGGQQVLLCVFRKDKVVCHDGSPGASPKHRTPAPAEAGAIQQACVPVFSGGAIVPGLVALTEGCSRRAARCSAVELGTGGIWEPILSTQEWNRLRPDLDLNPVSTGDAEPHSDDVWRGTAGGPATKALGDMNAVKAALPL